MLNDHVSVSWEDNEMVATLVDGRRLRHADPVGLAQMLLDEGVKSDQVRMPDKYEVEFEDGPSSGQKIALFFHMRKYEKAQRAIEQSEQAPLSQPKPSPAPNATSRVAIAEANEIVKSRRARFAKAVDENPGLPLQFVKDTLLAAQEAKAGMLSPYFESDYAIVGGEMVSGAGMTRDELAAAVPIRERNGRPFFVLMADIPEPWRSQFSKAMIGSGCPSFAEMGPCAFAWDWTEWLAHGRFGDGGPRGLDEC